MTKESTQRLKIFRKQLSVSQEYMADKFGLVRESYVQIESGKNGLKDEYLPILLELGLSLNWLFSGKGDMMLSDNAVNEDMHIYIASPQNVNKGTLVGPQIMNVSECQDKLAAAMLEIGYLKQQVADKELIIELFKNKK
jgi:DNA-binding XRE family transcriptional regulator